MVYGFDGFFAPVENPPRRNVVTAGQAIPVRFSLRGDHGMDIFASGYPASRQVSCASGDVLNPDTPTHNPGSSSLTYAEGNARYQYVWKTDESWAGSCRQLVIRFKDGSERTALFRFR